MLCFTHFRGQMCGFQLKIQHLNFQHTIVRIRRMQRVGLLLSSSGCGITDKKFQTCGVFLFSFIASHQAKQKQSRNKKKNLVFLFKSHQGEHSASTESGLRPRLCCVCVGVCERRARQLGCRRTDEEIITCTAAEILLNTVVYVRGERTSRL